MKIKGKELVVTKLYEGKEIINSSSGELYLFDIAPIKIPKGLIHFSFRASDINAEFKACIVNNKMKIVYNFDSNTDVYLPLDNDFSGRIMLKVAGKQSFTLEKIVIEEAEENYICKYLVSENLLISPGYPCKDDRYNCGFVHTRALVYKKSSFPVDIIWVGNFYDTTIYSYEGLRIIRLSYGDLRELLYKKQYERILIHFFNEKIARVINNLDLHKTRLYFYAHGAETLYRDWQKICCPYFQPTIKLTDDLLDLFEEKDKVINRYNEAPNAKWIFVTEWTKNHSEELLGIKYKNYDIVPCLIDTNTFVFREKDPELRKKIFILRKFHEINSYSIDLDVRAILELSHRECFKDLEFNIYGDGPLHDALLAPIRDFPNVKIHKKFLNSEEIAAMHKEHGIALFATRYDSQAVSSCEAASSGCVVVSTINPGILQEFDAEHNTLCEQENYKQYADVIERLYYNPDEFLRISKEMSKKIHNIYGYENTIEKELKMFEKDSSNKLPEFTLEKCSSPTLSVIIPAYNVSKYIKHTLWSLINHRNSDKLEILVINDGSKDDTLRIAQEYAKSIDNTGQIIKVIDKENGGHGSVLNLGVSLAKGKYVKIVDGDDTLNSEEFAKLLNYLSDETCDIVINNYCLDMPYQNALWPQKFYNMLSEGIEYNFDDLCFENYGFNVWGPLLSTSTYKLDMLKRRPFKTTEKIFYDDMEWNLNVYINCKTVKFYDLDLYNYLIGREGQSISPEALKRNYPMHRTMVASLLKIYHENIDFISDNKKQLIEKIVLKKMIYTHYNLIFDLIKSPTAFNAFDNIVKQYPYFYNCPEIVGKKTKFLRSTNGHFLFLQNIPASIKKIFKR